MIQTLYTASLFVYNCIFAFISLFHSKAAKIINGRKESRSQISLLDDSRPPAIWFHCASLGEWEQTIPVVEKIKAESSYFILLSFYSPSGFENAKRADLIDLKIYLPVDFIRNYRLIFQKFDIKTLVFTRYDLWPNLILAANNLKIPLILIGAEFKAGSRYLRTNSFFYKLISRFSYISCNDPASADLLIKAGLRHIGSDGSPKIERAVANTKAKIAHELLSEWCKNDFIILGGSVWSQEITLLAKFIQDHPSNIKVILAPHEPNDQSLKEIDDAFKAKVSRFSTLSEQDMDCQVIVIDSIGILSGLYHYADTAVIGGGFGKGIHNILEASVYGIPVISGPNNSKFSEADLLLNESVYFVAEDYNSFNKLISEFMNDKNLREKIKSKAAKFFEKQLGASQIISTKILKIISRDI